MARVQRLRVEHVTRRLERGDDAVEDIGRSVGSGDGAAFRGLLERLTGLTAGGCRRRLRLPGPAGAWAAGRRRRGVQPP